jgi:rRNA maturation endonuclease Nob1
VLQEIRDQSSRSTLGLKFDEVITKDAPADAYELVAKFSKTSGDDLSVTDCAVVALAYSLEQLRGASELRSEP